jgi:ABC-type multidrug transport system permease subunit
MPVFALIAWKDLHILLRDRVALFWVLGFPLVFAAFFGSVMKAGVEQHIAALPVVVIDERAEPDPARLAAALQRAGLPVSVQDAHAARDAVRRGQAVAFVRAPARRGAAFELGIDPSRHADGALLRSVLSGALRQPLPPPPRIEMVDVIRDRDAPQNGYQIVFPAMVLWGLIGCAATFAIGMVVERSSGTLLRLRAAPIARASVLAGKAAACFAACVLDAVLLSLVGALLLGVHIVDPPKYAAAIGATAACFAGLTMALCMIGRTEQAVAGAGWATLIVMAMLGGAMVPLSLMPDWLLSISDFSPVKWGILALEGATWRGLSWHELAGWLARLLAFGLAAFAGGVALLYAWREV